MNVLSIDYTISGNLSSGLKIAELQKKKPSSFLENSKNHSVFNS